MFLSSVSSCTMTPILPMQRVQHKRGRIVEVAFASMFGVRQSVLCCNEELPNKPWLTGNVVPTCPSLHRVEYDGYCTPCGIWWILHIVWNVMNTTHRVEYDGYWTSCGMWWILHIGWNMMDTAHHVEYDGYCTSCGIWWILHIVWNVMDSTHRVECDG